MDSIYLYIFAASVFGLIVGYCGQGNTANKPRTPFERFFQVVMWISIVVLFLFALLIVGALSDGIGDIPLIGGAVWVRGHWRRR